MAVFTGLDLREPLLPQIENLIDGFIQRHVTVRPQPQPLVVDALLLDFHEEIQQFLAARHGEGRPVATAGGGNLRTLMIDGKPLWCLDKWHQLVIAVAIYCREWDLDNNAHDDPTGWRHQHERIHDACLRFALRDHRLLGAIIAPMKGRRPAGD